MYKYINYLLFIIIIIVYLSSCQKKAYLNNGQYLLTAQTIKFEKQKYKIQEDIDQIGYELEPTYQQKLNTVLWPSNIRLKLGIYNQLYKYNKKQIKKDKKPKPDPTKPSWFWNIVGKTAQKPCILDTILTQKTVNSMQNYLNHKGYFKAEVFYTVKYKRKTAEVIYKVKTNERTLIDTCVFYSKDTNIQIILNILYRNHSFKGNIL